MKSASAPGTSVYRPPRVLHWGLAGLAMRGTLSPRRVAAWLAVLIVLACHDWAPAYSLLGADASGMRAEELARAFTRSGIWTGACIVLVPFLVLHAARTSADWRRQDELWLGARAIGRTATVCSTWLGVWMASTVLVVGTGLFIEALLPESSSSQVLEGSLPLPDIGWISGPRAARWTIPDEAAALPSAARVRLELGLGSGVGSASEVVFRARRVADSRSSDTVWTAVARERIATRGSVELKLPPARGAIELELSCADQDARFFVLSRAMDVWVPATSERSASLAIAIRSIVALCVWIALAVALGTVLRPWLAVALVLAVWIAIWLTDGVPSACPGADLWAALEIAGHGRVPQALTPAALPAALASAAGALAAGGKALGAWWARA